MSTTGWKSHMQSRGQPALEGAWGETPWAFYEYAAELPDILPIRTAMCVPVCSLNPANPQIMLTLNLQRGGYEIPGGHLDTLGDGTESPRQAAVRETREETGLKIDPTQLIPYGYIEARNDSSSGYPSHGYMQFFGAHAPEAPGLITDPEVDGAGLFSLDALSIMTQRSAMWVSELGLVRLGVRTVLRHQGLPDGQIALP